MLTVGSLFAGIGGFCSAFIEEDFKVLWANEVDANAALTYKHNYEKVKLYEKKIEDLSVLHDRIECVDVLTAGFPCQPFSIAGDRKGFEDDRGLVFFEIVRLLKEFGNKRPKIVLLENVPGLLGHNNGNTFSKMVNSLQSAGYWFMQPNCYAILNTLKITGIPQSRERLFMVALSWDCFNKQIFQFPLDINAEQEPLQKYLDIGSKKDESYYFPPDSKWAKLFEDSMEKGNPNSMYQLRRYYVRENKNDAVFTLTANMGEGGHNVPVFKDPWGIRKLTPEECLSLQGFNSNFEFPDKVARSQRYKQIGNAVTVPLVQLLAKECKRILRLEKND
jgi:DNA (cytosine-5)-methyltransferase 1